MYWSFVISDPFIQRRKQTFFVRMRKSPDTGKSCPYPSQDLGRNIPEVLNALGPEAITELNIVECVYVSKIDEASFWQAALARAYLTKFRHQLWVSLSVSFCSCSQTFNHGASVADHDEVPILESLYALKTFIKNDCACFKIAVGQGIPLIRSPPTHLSTPGHLRLDFELSLRHRFRQTRGDSPSRRSFQHYARQVRDAKSY